MMLGFGLWAGATVSGCVPADGQIALQNAAPIGIEGGELALAPLEFVRFCMNYASECMTELSNAVVELTPAVEAVLRHVNDDVNQRIQSTSETSPWRINPVSGNCNDYVVTKRHELIKLGLPASALLMAAARTPQGDGHLLLIVRTNKGNLVLDNLKAEILPIEGTRYAWLKRQSAVDGRNWEVM